MKTKSNATPLRSLFSVLCIYLFPLFHFAQPGLTVNKGVGVQDINGGIAVIGDPGGFHLAMDSDDIQAKNFNSTAARLDVNFYGGDIRMGGPANIFYLKHNVGLGLGTDNPAGPLHIGFGATGNLFAGTPGGNGPGWIYIAPDGDRWDTYVWNNGYELRRHGTDNFFHFSDGGRFGIGTDNPDGPMDIDFGSIGSVVAGTPGGNGPGWIHYASNGNRWDVFASIDGFNIWKNGTSSNMYLTNDGKLGIKLGFAGAASDLHVKQTTGNNYTTNGLRLEYGDNTNHWNTLIDAANDYLLTYNGVLKLWFSHSDGSSHQTSDRKVKQGIRKMPAVLERVNQLNPVTYRYRSTPDAERNSWGFIAQEVEPLFPDFVSEKKGIKGLAYDNFAVVSIKAIQELSTVVEKQEDEIADLKATVQELRLQMEKLLAKETESSEDNNYSLSLDRKASLSQNQPNPFRSHTVIRFFIPDDVQKAQIRIAGVDGRVLKEMEIGTGGAGQLTIEANTFPAGTYFYSLVLDGRAFETRQMVLTQ